MLSKFSKSILCCLLLLFSNLNAISQTATADPAYWNMQRAMGGILQQSAQTRGYSTTDPRTYSTLYGVGKAAAATVAGAGTALLVAGTAPAWGTFLAMSAIGGAVSYGVSLGIDSLVKWYLGPTNASAPISTQKPSTATSTQGVIPVVTTMPKMDDIVAASINTEYSFVTNNGGGTYYHQTFYSTQSYTNPFPGTYTIELTWPYGGKSYVVWKANTSSVPKTTPCPSNYTLTSGNCVLNSGTGTGTGTTTTANQTLDQAVAALSHAQLTQAVNNETMAYMLNELWKKAAAQSDYAGVPYSVTNPITAAEVQAWQQANPTAYPTVQGMMTPVTNPNNFYPSTSTSTTTAPTPAVTVTPPTGTNAGSASAPVNLGTDPNIKAPTLETTPTAQMILAPLTGLFPDLKSFVVPGHSGVCPIASFGAFNRSFSIDSHCNILENQRSSIFGFMMLVFVLASLFIILKA